MAEHAILWVPQSQTIVVPPGVSVPLASRRTLVSKIVLFADLLNEVAISIGPNGMSVASSTRPNVAMFQLDAGRDAEIFTDEIYTEFFDLHAMVAAHQDAVNSWYLYLTIYRSTNLGNIE